MIRHMMTLFGTSPFIMDYTTETGFMINSSSFLQECFDIQKK